MTLSDVVLDGTGLSNSACLGISTAYYVYIQHVQLQNCLEQATGCFRLTNWNNQQILSKNIFIKDSNFVSCKITLSGVTSGFLKDSVFIGATPVGSTRYLVDFSKGDIAPTSINMLSNFCLCGNTISGWQLNGIFAGFQAINNDTIAGNTIRGAAAFSITADTASGVSCSGLIIADNFYVGSTGGMQFGYCNNLTIRSNTFSADTTPAGSSTAFTFVKSVDPIVNTSPSNVHVTGNTISKWGGVGMFLGFITGTVEDNVLSNENQANLNANSLAGFLISADLRNTNIIGNTIVSDVASGAGSSRPVTYNGAAKNDTLTNNFFLYEADTSPSGGIFFSVGKDATFQIRYNRGYVTENQGSCAQSSATTCVVTHGLAGTPTSVQVTIGTTGAGTYFVTSVGATQFTITTQNSGTFTDYWEARYWP